MLLRNPFTRDARVLREARSLAAAGHEVTVLATTGPALPEREERDGVRIVRTVRAGMFAGPTIRGAAGAGAGASRPTPRPAGAVWLRDAVLGARFARAAQRVPADVYHAHDLPMLVPAARAARQHGARLVYDAHELYPEMSGLSSGERRRWRQVEARTIGRADAVLTPSASRAEELARRYGVRPVVVMNCPPSGPAPDPAASSLAPLRRRGRRLLVYVGGFIVNRGLENLLHATQRLDGCLLAMVGYGPLEATLRALASRLSEPTRVHFGGAVAPDEVIATAAAADVGLAPYLPIGLNNRLAAPNKLYEYLHAGVAIAGSDVPETRTIVEVHQVGTLFDASDPASIAGAVASLVGDATQLAKAKRNARRAAQAYSWESQERALLEVYEGLERARGPSNSE
jgi:glycosyltransferase involved in cell wall biosynthesis